MRWSVETRPAIPNSTNFRRGALTVCDTSLQRRSTKAILPVALGVLLVTTPRLGAASSSRNPAAPVSDVTGGVITDTTAVVALVADGMAGSPTFAAIVADLLRSDVLVTIEPARDLEHRLSGCTAFVARTRIRRYLRVRFDPRGSRADQIAVIGHELWHAREVAHHPEVTTPEAFRTLYATTGRPIASWWDSDGAIAADQRIVRELAARPTDDRR